MVKIWSLKMANETKQVNDVFFEKHSTLQGGWQSIHSWTDIGDFYERITQRIYIVPLHDGSYEWFIEDTISIDVSFGEDIENSIYVKGVAKDLELAMNISSIIYSVRVKITCMFQSHLGRRKEIYKDVIPGLDFIFPGGGHHVKISYRDKFFSCNDCNSSDFLVINHKLVCSKAHSTDDEYTLDDLFKWVMSFRISDIIPTQSGVLEAVPEESQCLGHFLEIEPDPENINFVNFLEVRYRETD